MARGNLLRREAKSYLTADDRYEAEMFYTPLAEGHGPQVFGAGFDLESDGESSEKQESVEIATCQGSNARTRRRSGSDSVAAHRHHALRPTPSPISVRFYEDETITGTRPPPQRPTSLHPLRPTAQRSTSTSRIELRSRPYDRVVSSVGPQQQPVERPKLIGTLFCPYRQTQNEMAVNKSCKVNRHNIEPNRNYHDTQSVSEVDVQNTSVRPKTPNLRTPLKPCLKRKAKSASNTPSSRAQRNGYTENRALRRVKTVDIIKGGKPLLALKPLTVKSKKTVDIVSDAPSPTNRNVHRVTSCPNIMNITKGDLASPAVTRTDVHVVAVASLWNREDFADEGIDPATPTTQILESKNSSYEAIWNDVLKEYSIRLHRRSSPASQALETLNSTPSHGLERVNTKLTDWRGNRDRSSESFRPTIMVFPDEGRPTTYDCGLDDGEHLLVSAPPNSRKTSAASSRIPSRPASAPLSRRASEEETALPPFSEKLHIQYNRDRANCTERPLHSEHRPGRLVGASRGKRRLSAPRKLSNIEEADLHFRGHHDSVTIARTRLIDSGGLSPELFAHRDSVSIAKKRMHAKDHVASAARRQIGISSEVWDDEVPLLATAKGHAARTLESQKLESILSPYQKATRRHIQTVE